MQQRTLNTRIQATGVGLHSGARIDLALEPAVENSGIVFRRSDLADAADLPARIEAVGATTLATTLSDGDARVDTIEHLMAAFAGLGIDNALVEVSSAEVPIMDGSAAPFVFLIESAGVRQQAAAKRFLRIRKPVKVEVGDAWAQLEPYDGYALDYTLAYDHPAFDARCARARVEFSGGSFVKEIARARTFGFLSDYERLRAMKLARGGSFDNAIVLDDYRVLNEGGLRQRDEFARHKILDAIGDLYLAGGPIIGAFSGYKSGHGLNNALLRALFADSDAFEWQTFNDPAELPGAYAQAFGS